jgi:pyrimidine-nucleoside phosphorylase
MTMLLPQELIRKKRAGGVLAPDELRVFFYGFLKGEVADYQMAAMLMATYFKGMTGAETAELTRVMRDSGQRLSWPYPRHLIVDKHSTGGIGDKTSIVLVPLCLLEGLKVPMMAGRGLGHTGGTLDKLEAVGWTVQLAPERVKAQMERLGAVIMGQTDQVAPLDRRLYAMRDVTATVESLPLIVGSILSKKLAEGIGGLVMDVKFGSGAFMESLTDARELATAIQRVGRECGIEVRCLLTDMGSPLGDAAGNALEIREAVAVLQGGGPADTRELTLELGVELVRLANPERSPASVRRALEEHLASGRAFERFLALAAAQDGDLGLLEHPERLEQARLKVPVTPATAASGKIVTAIDTRRLGIAILELGGGRRLVGDAIDPWVGLTGMKRVGAAVAPGEPVAVVHANDAGRAEAARALVESAYVLGEPDGSPAPSIPLIAERL